VVHFNPAVEKSYVAMERVSIDNKFSMTFKMKTTEKEGLLFYTADDTQVRRYFYHNSILKT
jgi:hypothetical protein